MKETEQTTLQGLLSGSRFEIPNYQRSYRWKQEQVGDFIDDVLYLIGDLAESRDDVNHYFGTIVLDHTGSYEWSATNDVDSYEVIDGQQRLITSTIFMSKLIDEIETVATHIDGGVADECNRVSDELCRVYVGEDGGDRFNYRVVPGEGTREPYSETLREGGPTSETHLSARRIGTANETVQSRIIGWRNQHTSTVNHLEDADQEDLEEYANYLMSVAGGVNNNLILTKNVVNSVDDAARMFKIINERGKDLSVFDRVKSHLVYCASEYSFTDSEKYVSAFDQDYDSIAKETSKRLKDAAETITSNGDASEADVDRFVKVHWTVWTGDYPALRRNRGKTVPGLMQNSTEYADPLDGEGGVIKEWIEGYTQSFTTLAEDFSQLRQPERFREENADGWETDYVADRLHGIMNSGEKFEYLPILVAAKQKFGADSEEFMRLVATLESFAVRYHQIMKNAGSIESIVGKGAYEIFWSDFDEHDVSKLFNEDLPKKIIANDSQEAINRTTNKIVEEIARRSEDEDLEPLLRADDVQEGSNTERWGGIRKKKKTIKYIMYEYEKALRRDVGQSLDDLPTAQEWFDDMSVERIVSPATASVSEDFPQSKLGNLAVIDSADYNRSKYRSPSDKHELYEESGLLILERLTEKISEWDEAAVDDRTDRLVSFFLNRWSESPSLERVEQVQKPAQAD